MSACAWLRSGRIGLALLALIALVLVVSTGPVWAQEGDDPEPTPISEDGDEPELIDEEAVPINALPSTGSGGLADPGSSLSAVGIAGLAAAVVLAAGLGMRLVKRRRG
jgi:hypothetical protein